jgi:hypothetical protein
MPLDRYYSYATQFKKGDPRAYCKAVCDGLARLHAILQGPRDDYLYMYATCVVETSPKDTTEKNKEGGRTGRGGEKDTEPEGGETDETAGGETDETARSAEKDTELEGRGETVTHGTARGGEEDTEPEGGETDDTARGAGNETAGDKTQTAGGENAGGGETTGDEAKGGNVPDQRPQQGPAKRIKTLTSLSDIHKAEMHMSEADQRKLAEADMFEAEQRELATEEANEQNRVDCEEHCKRIREQKLTEWLSKEKPTGTRGRPDPNSIPGITCPLPGDERKYLFIEREQEAIELQEAFDRLQQRPSLDPYNADSDTVAVSMSTGELSSDESEESESGSSSAGESQSGTSSDLDGESGSEEEYIKPKSAVKLEPYDSRTRSKWNDIHDRQSKLKGRDRAVWKTPCIIELPGVGTAQIFIAFSSTTNDTGRERNSKRKSPSNCNTATVMRPQRSRSGCWRQRHRREPFSVGIHPALPVHLLLIRLAVQVAALFQPLVVGWCSNAEGTDQAADGHQRLIIT